MEDEKMKKRIEALSRMTTKNGCTTHEEQVAQRKMKLLQELEQKRWKFKQAVEEKEERYQTTKPTFVEVFGEEIQQNQQETDFRKKFEELRQQNRQKWKIKQ